MTAAMESVVLFWLLQLICITFIVPFIVYKKPILGAVGLCFIWVMVVIGQHGTGFRIGWPIIIGAAPVLKEDSTFKFATYVDHRTQGRRLSVSLDFWNNESGYCRNIAIGAGAMPNLITGVGNICIGAYTCQTLEYGNFNIVIGDMQDVPEKVINNYVNIQGRVMNAIDVDYLMFSSYLCSVIHRSVPRNRETPMEK